MLIYYSANVPENICFPLKGRDAIFLIIIVTILNGCWDQGLESKLGCKLTVLQWDNMRVPENGMNNHVVNNNVHLKYNYAMDVYANFSREILFPKNPNSDTMQKSGKINSYCYGLMGLFKWTTSLTFILWQYEFLHTKIKSSRQDASVPSVSFFPCASTHGYHD